MIYTPVEQLLSDGEFHSGQAIADHLKVSRVAVWKQIQRLKDWGLELESVRGKGYRIPGGLDLLCPEQITGDLRHDVQLVLERSVGSTNDVVRKLHTDKPVYVLAEHQQNGRGRHMRPWYSPFASNIYLSTKWRLDQGILQAHGLSLVIGLAIARTMEREGLGGIQVKWPNDILVDGQKIAGVLIELEGDLMGSTEAIIGIGINFHLRDRSSISQPVADLKQLGYEAGRNRMIHRLIETLEETKAQYMRYGFSRFRPLWQQYDALWAKKVHTESGRIQLIGQAQGVDDRGGLRIMDEQGVMRVCYAGSIVSYSES